jgi:aspartyl-tRNA(Asn)/glutamyl-tRNA(Gln) amidotransferase subunit A
MARTVADLALLLDVIGRFDPRDPNALPDPEQSFVRRLTESGDRLDGVRVAYSANFGYVQVDADIQAAVAHAVDVLDTLGAAVEQVDPPFSDPTSHFHTLWFAGAEKIVSTLPQDRLDELDPALLALVEHNRAISAHDYLVALQARYEMASSMAVFHQSHDVLVSPTVGIPPFTAGLEVPENSDFRRWTGWAAFTLPFNMTQQPAVSIPCGKTVSGLPIALQIVAARGQDDLVLRVAGAFETAAGGFQPPPD